MGAGAIGSPGGGSAGGIGGAGDTAPLGAATGLRAFALGLCAGSGATALLWKIQKAGSVGVTSHPALLPCVGAAVSEFPRCSTAFAALVSTTTTPK